MQSRSRSTMRHVGAAIMAIVALVVVFSGYTVVNPGHRGVVVMLGKVEQNVLGEGFHLIMPPVVRQVVQVNARTKKLEVNTEAASSDLQAISATGVLNYHLEPDSTAKLYQEVGLGFESIIIVPAVQEAIKAATAQFQIDRILIERSVLKVRIREDLAERLSSSHITVDQFSMANVEFSDAFSRAIEQKQVAEQAALQKQYELQAAEKEVEITLPRAEGDRRAAVVAAEGRAEARRLGAQAEAAALNLIASELQGNPDLIPYEWATKLSPTVSTVMLPGSQDTILDAKVLTEN